MNRAPTHRGTTRPPVPACIEARAGLKRPIMKHDSAQMAWIVPAAGRGTRLAAPLPKALVEIAGRPLVIWTVRQLALSRTGDSLVMAIPSQGATTTGNDSRIREEDMGTWPAGVCIVEGGETRRSSVLKALAALPDRVTWLGIHDGARPLITTRLQERVLEAAHRTGAATAALAMHDSVRRVTDDNWEQIDRHELYRIQTPQIFSRKILEQALSTADTDDDRDEATTVEEAGMPVELVVGDPANIKVTTPADMVFAERLLAGMANGRNQKESRTGIGIDAHRLVEGIPLMLGGLAFDFPKGLEGHSDGDVLCHAVADALLSAARLGDLGRHFPSDDPDLTGISGAEILSRTAALLTADHWRIDSVDAVAICQQPAIAPFREKMASAMAEALGIDSSRVSVKATSTDGLGFTGRTEGIAAQAVVVVSRPLV